MYDSLLCNKDKIEAGGKTLGNFQNASVSENFLLRVYA